MRSVEVEDANRVGRISKPFNWMAGAISSVPHITNNPKKCEEIIQLKSEDN